MTTSEWFAAHLDDYRDALAKPGATPEYVAQQFEELRDLAMALIAEGVAP